MELKENLCLHVFSPCFLIAITLGVCIQKEYLPACTKSLVCRCNQTLIKMFACTCKVPVLPTFVVTDSEQS